MEHSDLASGGTGHEITLEVLDPTGKVVPKRKSIAPRPDTLEGKTIGLVCNCKPNADMLLSEIGKLLKERYPTAVLSPKRLSLPATKPPPGELERIARDIDVALLATGD